jgi:hypothetical protein
MGLYTRLGGDRSLSSRKVHIRPRSQSLVKCWLLVVPTIAGTTDQESSERNARLPGLPTAKRYRGRVGHGGEGAMQIGGGAPCPHRGPRVRERSRVGVRPAGVVRVTC